MIRTNRVIFAAMFSCAGSVTSASEFAYICEVSHVYSLTGSGSLETRPKSDLEQLMKKSSFPVSRETGALIGNSTTLDTSLAKSTNVIHRGSKDNSFKATADFGNTANGTHAYQFLEIEEFRKGPKKPFAVMGTLGIVTGVCH